jgi:hypothetical protein
MLELHDIGSGILGGPDQSSGLAQIAIVIGREIRNEQCRMSWSDSMGAHLEFS